MSESHSQLPTECSKHLHFANRLRNVVTNYFGTMGNILDSLKTKREARDTYKCVNTPSSESKFETNCLLDGFERDQESDVGNPGCQPDADLGVIMPRNCKKITIEWKSERGNTGQLKVEDQKVIEQIRSVTKQVYGLHKRMHINQRFNESVVGTENSLVDLQLYLIDVEEYLKTVPDHLHQTEDYERLKKLYEHATLGCGYAVDWLQSSKSWHRCPSDEALLIDGVTNH